MTVSAILSPHGGVNSGVLVTPGGTPIVPDWLQQEVFTATSGRGKLEWVNGLVAYYGLKVRWRPEDPRREQVRSGDVPESAAFDLDQIFPQDYSPQDIASYVRHNWGDGARMSASDAAKVAEAAVRRQQETQAGHIERFTHESTERSKNESSHAKRVRAGAESAHPMVHGADL